MIDLSAEKVISFTEATKILPRRRAGKRPHVATIYRWAKRGLRGVLLDTIQIGGTLCTSVEALQRFFNALDNGTSKNDRQVSLHRRRLVERASEKVRKIIG